MRMSNTLGADTVMVFNAEPTPPWGEGRVWRRTGGGFFRSAPCLVDADPLDGRAEVAVIDAASTGAMHGRIATWDVRPESPSLRWSYDLGAPGVNPYPAPPTVVNLGLRAPDLVAWQGGSDPAAIACCHADSSEYWTLEIDDPDTTLPGISTAAADLDGDGDVELASMLGSPPRLIIHGAQSATVLTTSDSELLKPESTAVIGDVDGDGDLEVVVSGGTTVAVFDEDWPSWPQDIDEPEWWIELPSSVVGEPLIGDFDGGDDAEIVVATASHELWVLKLPATGNTLEPVVEPPGFVGSYATGAICDLDRDGSNEVVFATSAGLLYNFEYWGLSEPRFEWPMYRHDARHSGLYAQPVSGELTGSASWFGTLTVPGDVTVGPADTLWLAAGTVVDIATESDCEHAGRDTASVELIVEGRLHGVESEGNPIVLASGIPAGDTGGWLGISLEESAACTLAGARVVYPHIGVWGLGDNAVSLTGCTLDSANLAGVYLDDCGAGSLVAECEINGGMIGIEADASDVTLIGNTVSGVTLYGIKLHEDEGSRVVGNTVSVTGGVAPGQSAPKGIAVSNCWSGVEVVENTVAMPEWEGCIGISLSTVQHNDARADSNEVVLVGERCGNGFGLSKTTTSLRWNRVTGFEVVYDVAAKRQNVPDLGDTTGGALGMNSSDDRATYNIKAKGFLSPALRAQGNWWGTADPEAPRFDGTGIQILWEPYLTEDPWESRGMALSRVEGRTWLAQNSPNPFNPVTVVSFGLAESGPVELAVYDVAGRRVRVLLKGDMPAGEHQARWDGTNDAGQSVGSGVYFCRLRARTATEERKLVLLK